MAEPRPFPPSPRRLALARASGLHGASPLLVGAAAAVALIGAVVFLARAMATHVGGWIAAACSAADGAAVAAATTPLTGSPLTGSPLTHSAVTGTGAPFAPAVTPLAISNMVGAVLELALPVIGAAAIAAVVIHLAQTQTIWLPRRRLPSAPTLPRHDVSRAALDILGAAVIGAVCIGWLWTTAPQLAGLVHSPRAAGTAIASLLVALAITWVALGVLDALVRRVQLAGALAMTRDEKREDDRLAAADPRWRAQRLGIMRGGSVSDAVARAAFVLLGDDVAVAIAWDATRRPVPMRTATGRRARATQLLALARRHRIAVHRDAALAARLVDNEGPVPESEWPRVAELIAAVSR